MGKVKELMSEPLGLGDRITTVGQLRQLIADLDDHDQICIETCDENGDADDLHPMYMDVIENVRLTDDTIVREVRFCQMPNVVPDVRDYDYDSQSDCIISGQHLKSCDDDGFCNNCGHQ